MFYFVSLLVTLLQRDLKILVAYSSVFHILSALLLFRFQFRFQFRFLLFLIHSLSSSVLFILVSEIFYIKKTRNLFLRVGVFSIGVEFVLLVFFVLFINLGAPPRIRFFFEINFFYLLFLWGKFRVVIIFIIFILNVFLILKFFLSFIFGKVRFFVNNITRVEYVFFSFLFSLWRFLLFLLDLICGIKIRQKMKFYFILKDFYFLISFYCFWNGACFLFVLVF